MNRVAIIALLMALTVPLANSAYAGPSAPAGPAFLPLTPYDVYQMSCGHQPKLKSIPYCELSFGRVTVLDKPIPRQVLKGFEEIPCSFCKLQAPRVASYGDMWYFDPQKRAWVKVPRKPECTEVTPPMQGCFPDVWR